MCLQIFFRFTDKEIQESRSADGRVEVSTNCWLCLWYVKVVNGHKSTLGPHVPLELVLFPVALPTSPLGLDATKAHYTFLSPPVKICQLFLTVSHIFLYSWAETGTLSIQCLAKEPKYTTLTPARPILSLCFVLLCFVAFCFILFCCVLFCCTLLLCFLLLCLL